MKIGNRVFDGGTHVMGILNLTPDSFFDKSRVDEKTVLSRAKKMIADGAEILDLGAQSTRPGFIPVSAAQEIKRLSAAILLLKNETDVPLSVDTDKPEVAEAALELGADMINDIWGLQQKGDMAAAVARHNAAVCIMHNKTDKLYEDMFAEIREFFKRSLDLAKKAGVDFDKIALDGGIGFAKNREQNFELLNGYEKIRIENLPLLLGTSRKSMFGGDVSDRLAPTLDSTRLAVRKNVLFVRVHDVAENKKAIDSETELIAAEESGR